MKKIIGVLLFCVFPYVCSAQLDLGALKRQSDSKAQQRKQEGAAFQTERNAQWGNFMDIRKEEWAKVIASRDVEWTGLLSDSEWTLFDGFLTNKRPEEPKPVTMPKAEPVTRPAPEPIVLPERDVVKIQPVLPVVEPQPEELPCKPAEPLISSNEASFSFYGRPVSVGFDKQMADFRNTKATQKDISNFWKNLSETNYTPTVSALLEAKSDIGLSDWGYYLLVRQFSEKMYSDWNSAILLTWFILVRSGYDARVGMANSNVALLLPSNVDIYDLNYLKIAGINYYMISSGQCASLYTYEGNYQNGRQFDLYQRRPLSFNGNTVTRNLNFSFQGKEYSFDFKYDPNVIEYYKALPQAQFEVFFDAVPSMPLRNAIENNLKQIVNSMDKAAAMNFLLQFVQLSFAYKTDPEQFGYEKYFYADELFAYPYCDCEDRSVLFSYLVSTLMGYEVVGTEFPGHMATAVNVDYEVSGTQYSASGKTYTIADPTYMNAKVGQCMPRYESATPKIHKLDIIK